VEPRLAHFLGLEERALGDARDLYAAWRVYFERMAAQLTTVLVFEDLQWADSGLLDFIEYLLEWSRNSPILVVTLARPEFGESRPGWGTGKRGLTSLFLEPLSTEAMGDLLNGMVPGLPEDLRALILDRAAGVPLYAVETVRMLIHRGLLVEERGAYRAHGSLEALEVPESLHALIAARLDSLAPLERSLLQDAAVLGKSFTANAVSAVTNIPEPDVEPVLASLVGKDLLAIQSDPRSPERGQYVFVQDLIRSVAHGTLARRERKLRHLAAATYLASAWTDEEEIAEVVAAHLVEAYDAEPAAADAQEIRDQARLALVRAAEHADSLGGAASAQRYYEHALELADSDETRADLHRRAGKSSRLQGRGAEVRAHIETAQSLYAATGQPLGQAMMLCELAVSDFDEGKVADALRRTQEALATVPDAATDDEHEATLANIEARLARFMYFSSDYDAALPHVERALQIAETADLWDVLALALDTKGSILAARGRRIEAEVIIRGALNLALEHDLTERASGRVSASPQPSRKRTGTRRRSICMSRRRDSCSGWVIGRTRPAHGSTASWGFSTSAGGARSRRCSTNISKPTPRSSARACGRALWRSAPPGCMPYAAMQSLCGASSTQVLQSSSTRIWRYVRVTTPLVPCSRTRKATTCWRWQRLKRLFVPASTSPSRCG
jgi:predicted ATPase